jgi:hypothetical protein
MKEDLVHRSRHSGRVVVAALGGLIGAVIGLAAVLVTELVVSGDQNGLFWLPAGIVTGIFVGAMVGLLLVAVIIGGLEDELDTAEAKAALEHEAPARIE